MKRNVLLNPGPVMISNEVRQALLQPDICHREDEFFKVLTRVRERLTDLFYGDERYATTIFNGSGTAALEAVISSAVRGGKMLVLSNGYYGEKIAAIGKIHGIDTRVVKHEWGSKIDPSEVARMLKADDSIRFVAMVHNETSTAMLNDVRSIGELVSEYGRKFIVDAISSIGTEDISIIENNIHFCVGSPNKCIESIPGLSFVCASKRELERLKGLPARTSYLDLYAHYVYEEGLGDRLGTPFTPAVQAFYALDKALDLLFREGIEDRLKRYASRAEQIRKGLHSMGFRFFIPLELMSSSITSILTPKNFTYETLHEKLKKRGFVIYAGQGGIEKQIFRIANMGVLTIKDIKQFLESLRTVLDEIGYPEYA